MLAAMSEPDRVIAELLERCRADHQAWINGDGRGYALPADGTILGAVGGWSTGGHETASRQRAVATQWRTGTGTVELVRGAVVGDVAWLVMVERAQVELTVDEPGVRRRWDLRVTEVFTRVEDDWVRVHRHADPLVDRRSPAEAAGLLR